VFFTEGVEALRRYHIEIESRVQYLLLLRDLKVLRGERPLWVLFATRDTYTLISYLPALPINVGLRCDT
jgi:hypothetical protein